MHRMIRTAVAATLLVSMATLVGCAQPGAPISPTGAVRVDATADRTTVELARGAELVVALEGNPTTGYDWKVADALPAQLVAKSDTLESSAAEGVVGAGGMRVLTYTAADPGTGVLELEYVRSWEKGVPPLKTFSLTLVVK